MGKLIKIKDTLTPDLRKRARAASNKRPLLQAMGTAIQSLGQQAFTDAGKRPAAWAPRKDDHPHPLLMGQAIPKSQGGGTSDPQLAESLRTKVEASRVIILSDRPYAAVHQLGGAHIPARPFLPFYESGRITPEGAKRAERALRAALKSQGL